MNEEFWAGSMWNFRATILNNGANSGDHVYSAVLADGDEMEVLYGRIENSDTASRAGLAKIFSSDGDELASFGEKTLNAGAILYFPNAGGAPGTGGAALATSKFMVSGAMEFQARVNAVGTSKDTFFAIACRLRGDPPTVTLTSPTGATETISTNEVL